MKPQLVVAIHGILTRQAAGAWQEHFSAYVDERADDGGPHIYTLEKQYWAGTFPILNMLFINHFLAVSLAKEIVDVYLKSRFVGWVVPEISFIAHSNGADVAIKTIALLAKWGYRVKAVVLIAGAVNPDVRANGIDKLVCIGKLGAAFAYSSHADKVLGEIPAWALWPYGRLGCAGFTSVDRYGADIRTRWFEDYDHGTYFTPDHEQQTFAQAIADIITS